MGRRHTPLEQMPTGHFQSPGLQKVAATGSPWFVHGRKSMGWPWVIVQGNIVQNQQDDRYGRNGRKLRQQSQCRKQERSGLNCRAVLGSVAQRHSPLEQVPAGHFQSPGLQKVAATGSPWFVHGRKSRAGRGLLSRKTSCKISGMTDMDAMDANCASILSAENTNGQL